MAQPVAEGLFTDQGLIGGLCAACHRRHFPRAATCPWCGATEISTVTLAKDGTLWAWTAITTAPPGYDGETPYGFGVVELPADRLRVVTRLTEADPAVLKEGMAVHFAVVPLSGELTTWAFGP